MRALRPILALSELTLPFPLSTPHGILGHLPEKALFALQEAPCMGVCLVTTIQADQQERGQNGQDSRASHARARLGHLPLPQGQPALQCFSRHLNAPPPRVDTAHGPGARRGAIGHEDFDALRPLVTPFFGPYDRDIAQMMQRGATGKDPGILPAPIRCVAGPAGGTALREVVHEVAARCALRTFPGAWHRTDLRRVFCRHQAQGRVRRPARLGDHHDLAHPGWGDTVPPPLPAQDVLRPPTRGVKRCQGKRDAPPVPTRHAHDHRKTTAVWVMRTVARGVPHRRLPPPRVLQRALPDPREDPRRRGWERPYGCRGHRLQHGMGIPRARSDHPQGRPRGKLRRQRGPTSLEGARARIADQRHDEPAEHEKVLRVGTAKVPLARGQDLIDLAGEALRQI